MSNKFSYAGDSCEIQLDYCASKPCESGKCLNTAEGFFCDCMPGVIGRRCHLRPCDYMPCPINSICIDLAVYPATRNSFTCQCPIGLKGFDCSIIDNPCDKLPCKNQGSCIPNAIRNLKNGSVPVFNETLYSMFRCECPPYFYGEFCETLTTPDFVMEFSKSGINDYVELRGPRVFLEEVSIID